jgi:hypothetical protein
VSLGISAQFTPDTITERLAMSRREVLAAAAVAGVTPLAHLGGLDPMQAAGREFYELRRYTMLPGAKQRLLNSYLSDAAIPAMRRAGTGPVGVFSVVYGTNSPTLYVLIVHPTLDSVATLRQRLWQDSEYLKAGAPFLDVAQSDPAFVRVESSLLHAFEQMPKLEVPAGAGARGARILELRRYESHSDKAAIRKIEMFNKGGEIPIFKRAGLNPVFFSESVIGDNQPSLTYMLSHTDMAARDAGWAKFNSDPDWKKLSADPYYAATVSSVTDIILRPAAFSQI